MGCSMDMARSLLSSFQKDPTETFGSLHPFLEQFALPEMDSPQRLMSSRSFFFFSASGNNQRTENDLEAQGNFCLE